MAAKFISVSYDSLEAAFSALDKLGLTAGLDAIIELDATIRLKPQAISRLIEAFLRSNKPPDPGPECPNPIRRDRVIHITRAANLKLLEGHQKFLAAVDAAGDDLKARQAALEAWAQYRRSLRLELVLPAAEADVVQGSTGCYGAELPGATTLQNTGEIIRCDRVIHITHPVSPEDLHLRERNVWCKEIFRYHVPGLDDAAWNYQNEPLQTITPEGYRELLALRAARVKNALAA